MCVVGFIGVVSPVEKTGRYVISVIADIAINIASRTLQGDRINPERYPVSGEFAQQLTGI
jgi:hypothetical protein